MLLKDNLKRIRKSKKISQKKLAELSGISYSMVSKLESGEQSNPSLDTLDKIASALGVKSSNLIGINEKKLKDGLAFIEYLISIGYEYQIDKNPTEWDIDPTGVKFPIAFDESPNAPCCTIIKDGVVSTFTNQQFEEFQDTIEKSVEFEIFKTSQK